MVGEVRLMNIEILVILFIPLVLISRAFTSDGIMEIVCKMTFNNTS